MRPIVDVILIAVLVGITAGRVVAHITPPVVLVSDRDAVIGLLTGARRYFVREVKLTPEKRQTVQQRSGWSPDESFYRFYVGRDDQGQLIGTMAFMTEDTIHGPVRVAVGLDPEGKVRGATVVELTEETYPWVKPLLDRDFARDFVGLDSRASFALKPASGDSMGQFYGQIVASLIQRATVLYDVTLAGPPKR